MPDTIFIFALALIIFGPKKLPEIGRQLGKLVGEFRRASNEFKMQIEEELRMAEQSDRQKQIAADAAAPLAAAVETRDMPDALTVKPPSTGEIESAESPFKPYSSPATDTPVDDGYYYPEDPLESALPGASSSEAEPPLEDSYSSAGVLENMPSTEETYISRDSGAEAPGEHPAQLHPRAEEALENALPAPETFDSRDSEALDSDVRALEEQTTDRHG